MQTTSLSPSDHPLATVTASELVARCTVRDCAESWQEFLHRYGWALAATVRRALAGVGRSISRDVHEDLLQEIYCRLLADGRRRLRNCQGEDDRSVTGYLCRIAENVVVDHLRRSNAVKRGRRLLAKPSADAGVCPVAAAPDPRASADRKTLVRESRRIFFDQAIQVLRGPNRRRDLLVTYLAVFEGWSSGDIARRLGPITANNVDSVVHRTKQRLAAAGLKLGTVDSRTRR